MKPELIETIDNDKYVYARCQCPVDTRFAIKIRRKRGTTRYSFKCDVCETEGVVIAGYCDWE